MTVSLLIKQLQKALRCKKLASLKELVRGSAPRNDGLPVKPARSPQQASVLRVVMMLQEKTQVKLGLHFEATAGGFKVTAVERGSPAAASGLKMGDVIIAASPQPDDRQMISVSSMEIEFFVALMREADDVFFRVRRNEHEFSTALHKVV